MPLNKAKGQMYDWITHTWPVGRGCSHSCTYCFVKDFGGQPVEFVAQPKPDLGKGKTIFVGNCIDLFAADMPQQEIDAVLRHCNKYPGNKYVFQTKNPWRMYENLHSMPQAVPGQSTLGTTIETDDAELLAKHSKAPPPMERAEWIRSCSDAGFKTFLTIEPVMRFNLEELLELIKTGRPNFINIGADSKGHNLPEPSHDETLALVDAIKAKGIKLILKLNLGRILKNQ